MDKNFKMVATTIAGLEGVLADELRKLGAQNVKEGIRSCLLYTSPSPRDA